MEDWPCECSFDYGPCEEHGEVLAQREGASHRTADELLLVFIDDALAIDAECLSPHGRETVDLARAALDSSGWIELGDLDDSRGLAQALADVAYQVENHLGEWVTWDDGYIIVHPSSDCPLFD